MSEYVLLSDVISAFELVWLFILFNFVISLFTVFNFFASFVIRLIDFTDDKREKKDKKLQYSEYLKWSKGLSVKIERADIKLIMNALNEFYIADARSENDLKDIDALKEKIKLLQNSPFRRFTVTPVFTQEDKV